MAAITSNHKNGCHGLIIQDKLNITIFWSVFNLNMFLAMLDGSHYQKSQKNVVMTLQFSMETCNKNQRLLSFNQYSTLTYCQPPWLAAITKNNILVMTDIQVGWQHDNQRFPLPKLVFFQAFPCLAQSDLVLISPCIGSPASHQSEILHSLIFVRYTRSFKLIVCPIYWRPRQLTDDVKYFSMKNYL